MSPYLKGTIRRRFISGESLRRIAWEVHANPDAQRRGRAYDDYAAGLLEDNMPDQVDNLVHYLERDGKKILGSASARRYINKYKVGYATWQHAQQGYMAKLEKKRELEDAKKWKLLQEEEKEDEREMQALAKKLGDQAKKAKKARKEADDLAKKAEEAAEKEKRAQEAKAQKEASF